MNQKTLCVLLSVFLLDIASALQPTPDLGTLAAVNLDRYYKTPVLMCHSNFNVTIEAGDWSLIAVEGYELENGNYGFSGGNDTMCVSVKPYADIHFDIQDHCHGGRKTMKVFNNTYTWTLRARAEWMVETQQDRLFPMKCEYTLTGEGQWESVTKLVTQIFSTEAAVEATRSVKINGSEIHLVSADPVYVYNMDTLIYDLAYPPLDSVQVGQRVRFVIDTKNTGWHSETPYVGVTGCWFYDRDPYDPDAMQFTLVDQYGCNKPPSYYDPFTAAATPGVNGMYLNHQPMLVYPGDEATDPMLTGLGYLAGQEELGMAYSDQLKMFKFPGTTSVWARCELRFCVEKNDPRCITPNCQGKFYTGGFYGNGAVQTDYRKRRSAKKSRGADSTEGQDIREEVITVIAVTSPGSTTKIGVNGPGDMLTLESEMMEGSTACETKFYSVLSVTVCLGLTLLGILIVYLFKRAAGRISPVDKARFIEDHYGRPNSVGGGMYGGGMRMNMMPNSGGGLSMISK